MFKRSIREEVVFIANGYIEAESIKIFLESFGIPTYTNQESAGLVYGFTVGQLGEVEILVPLDRVEEAKKILKDMKEGKLEDNEEK